MEKFTLRDVMRVLQEGWGEYIKQFNALSPEERAMFLQKEGFADFHDLLGHVIGWWEEGLWVMTGILDDPSFTWEERDADAFNVELIDRFRSWSEEDLLLHYENVREALLNLVADLPENALDNEDIRDWLYADVIEHLEDHRIPSPVE
ncbi:MAG: hypothetical protein WBL25_20820 [Anaerolineales bacterium]